MCSRFIYLFIWIFTSILSAQEYYVINVKGEVLIEDNQLRKGDKISEDVSLVFASQEDVLYLLSPDNGYLAISPIIQRNKKNKELIVALRQAILPKNRNHLTASRGDARQISSSFSDKYDMMAYFRKKIALFENHTFHLNFAQEAGIKNVQLVNLDHLSKPQIHILSIEGKVMDLHPQILGLTEGNYKLLMEDAHNEEEIGQFFINLLSQEEIIDEFGIIANNASVMSKQEVFNSIFLPYFYSFHGHIDQGVLQRLLL